MISQKKYLERVATLLHLLKCVPINMDAHRLPAKSIFSSLAKLDLVISFAEGAHQSVINEYIRAVNIDKVLIKASRMALVRDCPALIRTLHAHPRMLASLAEWIRGN